MTIEYKTDGYTIKNAAGVIVTDTDRTDFIVTNVVQGTLVLPERQMVTGTYYIATTTYQLDAVHADASIVIGSFSIYTPASGIATYEMAGTKRLFNLSEYFFTGIGSYQYSTAASTSTASSFEFGTRARAVTFYVAGGYLKCDVDVYIPAYHTSSPPLGVWEETIKYVGIVGGFF